MDLLGGYSKIFMVCANVPHLDVPLFVGLVQPP